MSIDPEDLVHDLEEFVEALEDEDWQRARELHGGISSGLDDLYREAREDAGLPNSSEDPDEDWSEEE